VTDNDVCTRPPRKSCFQVERDLNFAIAVVQFTYFQQAGGRPLPIPAVEITYGLERILMALQVGFMQDALLM
jgi:Glycyl-tRNA synthetase alpha subunit